MRDVQIEAPEQRSIKINGIEYVLLAGDRKIAEEYLAIKNEFAKQKLPETEKEGMETFSSASRMIALVDEALGPGAFRRITNNVAMSGKEEIGIASKICTEILNVYQERVEQDYE